MKKIIPYNLFEFELYRKEEPVRTITRYVLHISDPENRESIMENGLEPKLPGKKWNMLGTEIGKVKDYWNKPSIFATQFKDSIDVYDVKDVDDYVFPLMGISDDANVIDFDTFISKKGLEFIPKKRTGRFASIGAQDDYEEWLEDVNNKYNNYLVKNSNFDVWVIDTEKIPNVKWFIDIPHEAEDSIYTTEKIPAEAVELLVPSNKQLVNSIDENVNHSKVLFLHGLDSRPYEDRVEILKASGADIFAPHINYREDDEVEIATSIIEKEGITHLVGHSLGGILSYYLSNKYKIPALMFNPAFGSHNLKYFESIDKLKELPIYNEQYAVVGMRDNVVNPFVQLANLKHATVWKEGELGHKIDPDTYRKYFELFCDKTGIK